MKILLILESHFYMDENGDVFCDRVVDYNFLKRYLSIFSEVIVCGRTDENNNGSYKLKINGDRVKFKKLPNFYGIKGLLFNLLKIKKLINLYVDEADVVLYRVPTPLSIFTYNEVLKKKKVLGVEFMISADKMIEGSGIIKKICNKLIDRIAKKICKKANGVSYVTDYVLQTKYPCKSIIDKNETDEYFSANYSTIELQKKDIVAQKWEKDYKPNVYKIIHTGFMDTYRKGQDILIKASKILIDKGYNIDVTLIGDGKKRNEFEKLANDLKISNKIHFIGSLKDKDKIFEYLRDSHLLVFPTEAEGLPRTIIEGMASGLPCISSPVDGIIELIDSKYLVNTRSSEEYAKAISFLLDNWDLMIELGNKNYEKAKKYEKSLLDKKRQAFYEKLSNLALKRKNMR
ncbi:MAG: glycosyltransferase family 4 protein [Bacilli bacterium]|nr:glycosyltransferase family 4 protein [Bacilli bacterium]